MHRILRLCLLIVLAHPVLCQERASWPEWRGGSAQGHADVHQLPVHLDPNGPSLQWNVTPPGRGISSPIVVGDRVFVTTAHRYAGGLVRLKSIVVVAFSAMALLLGAILLLLLVRRRVSMLRPGGGGDGDGDGGGGGGGDGDGDGDGRDRPFRRWLVRIDRAAVVLATCAFVGFALTATFSPDALWTLGRPGEAWLITGAIMQLGLATASGWTFPGGRLRLITAIALLAAGALVWIGIPLDRYGIQHGVLPRALALAPGVVFACWSFATWPLLSRRAARTRANAVGTRAHESIALSTGGALIAGVALMLFASVNSWERDDRLARSLLCYDLETGAPLWERVLLVAPKEQKWPNNSYATPTPCSDGTRVFAYFGAGWGCVDLDGDLLWTGEDPDFTANSRYGTGASPIIERGQVLLWQENEMKNRRSYLMSLDMRTGAVNWRVEPEDVHDSYSTPIVITRKNGQRELIAMAYRKLVAHSTVDGSRLWELPLPARQFVPSLCYAGDDLLLVSGGTHLGFSTSGVKLEGDGAATTPRVLWQTHRNLSDICSPVLGDGLYFTIIDGRMRCIDPHTGKIHWTGRLGATDYWASLVAGDGKVYALSGEGELTTVAMDASKCRILSESMFDELCFATPAVVEGRILVRTAEHLYCFGARGSRQSMPVPAPR